MANVSYNTASLESKSEDWAIDLEKVQTWVGDNLQRRIELDRNNSYFFAVNGNYYAMAKATG